MEYIKQQGFKSIFDACVGLLLDGDFGSEKAFKNWVTRDGRTEFPSACANHSQFKLNPSFADQIHAFAKKVYEKEVGAPSKALEFKRSSRGLIEASNVVSSIMDSSRNTLRLSSLLESLTTLSQNSNKSTVGITSTNPLMDTDFESEWKLAMAPKKVNRTEVYS